LDHRPPRGDIRIRKGLTIRSGRLQSVESDHLNGATHQARKAIDQKRDRTTRHHCYPSEDVGKADEQFCGAGQRDRSRWLVHDWSQRAVEVREQD
jgi:hypothetical protein